MTRVCVIGGGTAGGEAAREAAMCGADVTVLERSESRAPPWKSWPDLIAAPQESGLQNSPYRRPVVSFAEMFGEEVRSAAQGIATTIRGVRFYADAVIVTTGCGFEPRFFPGQRKSGVAILDGADKYAELGRARGSIESAVVHGDGVRGMQVAERLAGSGRKVRLFVSSWPGEGPSSRVQEVLSDSASERGIVVSSGTVARAIGTSHVEGVVAEGEVVLCDTVAVAPRRVPRTIFLRGGPGPHGGILVNSRMETGTPGIFAAGGCGVLESGLPQYSTLEAEAGVSGRIAGANSTGRNLRASHIRSARNSMFGLKWLRAGIGGVTCRSLGLDVGVVSRRWDRYSACTIVYERRNGRVFGVEALEPLGSPSTESPLLTSGSASLRTLAYGGVSNSSDISLVSDTARLGLLSWSRS